MAYSYSGSPVMPPVNPIQRAHTPTVASSPQGPIQPGTVTYTTTTGPDGQFVYHCFKAIAASYQTPQGVVTGIQWIPAEATSILPAGATPADDQFRESFSRTGEDRWDREDSDRMRRREDKERRRLEKEERRLEKEERRFEREREDSERELRRAREERERRRSGYGYENLDRQFGEMGIKDKGYGSVGAPYTYAAGGPYAAATQPIAPRPVSPYVAPGTLPQRAPSPYAPPGAGIGRAPSPYAPGATAGMARAPSPYAPPPAGGIARAPSPYGPPSSTGIGRAASPYGAPPPAAGIRRAPSPYGAPPSAAGIRRAPSPYGAPPPLPPGVGMARAASPYGSPTAPAVYPPGHVMEGRPYSASARPISRSSSPVPPGAYSTAPSGYGYSTQGAYSGATPGAQYGTQYAVAPYPPGVTSPIIPTGEPQQMLSAPEGFSRPSSMAQPYTRFETFKIQDMDEFYENIPKMPYVLQPHDVYHEDWIRLMTDLSMAWSGKLPVPEYAQDGRPPKRTVLTADLIDLWNTSFFLRRGVEVVLFKGRERRSGRLAGNVELHLPGFDDITAVSESESESSESESDEDDYDRSRYNAYGGVYGRQSSSQIAELAETRRLRREKRRAEKKRRRQEKKQRRKQKEAERTYALYAICVPREL